MRRRGLAGRHSTAHSGLRGAPRRLRSANCPTTAAARLGWGAPTRASDFDAGLPPDWHPYGPEVGHDEKGVRTPQAITVADGAATISATADGTTGAMSWHPGQRYGRWEACVRMDRGPDALHGVLILWPVAEDFPAGGEIDWMEIFRGDRQEATVNIHHGPPDRSFGGAVEHDATQWTAWAVEWTPEHITTYRDGEQWYTHRPRRPLPAAADEHDHAARLVPARGRRPGVERVGHAPGLGTAVGAAADRARDAVAGPR